MARRLILDSGGLIAVQRGDRRVMEAVKAARAEGVLVIPAVVLAQVLRGGARDAPINQLLRGAHVPFVGLRLARLAGRLIGASGVEDAADALIAAEALRGEPCVLVTSDPDDMRRLIQDQHRVRIFAV